VREELGIVDFEPVFMLRYQFRSEQEAELVHSYYAIYDGAVHPNPTEISEGRFWSINEIKENTGLDILLRTLKMNFN